MEAETVGAVCGFQFLLALVKRQGAEIVCRPLVRVDEDALGLQLLVAERAEEGRIELLRLERNRSERLVCQFQALDAVEAEMLEFPLGVLLGKQVPAPLAGFQGVGTEGAVVRLRVGEFPIGAGEDAVAAQSRANNVQMFVSTRDDEGLHLFAKLAELLQEEVLQDVRHEGADHLCPLLLVGGAPANAVAPDVLAAVAREDVNVHCLTDERQVLDESLPVVARFAVALDKLDDFLAGDTLGVLEHFLEDEVVPALQFHVFLRFSWFAVQSYEKATNYAKRMPQTCRSTLIKKVCLFTPFANSKWQNEG